MLVSVRLSGGLGNQLFQIFTLIAYSLKYKIAFVLQTTFNSGNRHLYWDTFLKNLFFFTKNHNSVLLNYNTFKEVNFHYNEIPEIKTSNLILEGYFQSYKYFDNYFFDIIKYIKLNEILDLTKVKYFNYFKNNVFIISLHFRLGDYKNLQDYYCILDLNYYFVSLKYITNKEKREKYNIIYFCEEQDTLNVLQIIKELENKFPNCNFIQINTTISDWEQMLLMSLCDANIIANSTFSCWGAYIGYKLNNKTVCYPSKWFGPNLSHYNVEDLFLNEWTKIC